MSQGTIHSKQCQVKLIAPCWLLGWRALRQWRWRQYFPPKHRLTSTELRTWSYIPESSTLKFSYLFVWFWNWSFTPRGHKLYVHIPKHLHSVGTGPTLYSGCRLFWPIMFLTLFSNAREMPGRYVKLYSDVFLSYISQFIIHRLICYSALYNLSYWRRR